jgi:hypothetical protein
MAISWKGGAILSMGLTVTTSPGMPVHAAGDLLLAVWTGKPFNAGVSVSGWTDLGSGASGSTAAGVDLGSMKAQVWWKEAASAAETAPSFVEGSPTWNVAGCGVICWQKGGGETWDTPVVVYGGDEDLDANISATMASDPGFTSGDGVSIVIGCNSDATTPLTAGPGITATDATFGTVTKDRDLESTAGGDHGMITAHCLVTAGTSSAAAVVTGTGTADPGDPRMEVGIVRLRLAGAAATSLIYDSSMNSALLVR